MMKHWSSRIAYHKLLNSALQIWNLIDYFLWKPKRLRKIAIQMGKMIHKVHKIKIKIYLSSMKVVKAAAILKI